MTRIEEIAERIIKEANKPWPVQFVAPDLAVFRNKGQSDEKWEKIVKVVKRARQIVRESNG